jgi:hypothetical protein
VAVFEDVGVVDPAEGRHEEIVDGRGEVAGQGEEEERGLQDVALDEGEGGEQGVVPGEAVEGEEEGEDVEDEFDGEDLGKEWGVSGGWLGGLERRGTNWEGDEQLDDDAGCDGYDGLLVVFRVEEVGVLEGAVGWRSQCWSPMSD